MAKKISLAEVARSLGVSKTLVSLVINNKADEHGISAETQQRVREKIKELIKVETIIFLGFQIKLVNIGYLILIHSI